MDPNLFHINYETLFEVLVTVVVLSILVERALSVLFESRLFISKTQNWPYGIKELISVAVSIAVCVYWKFDAISILIVSSEHMTIPGMILTGGIVAGGAKGSMKLFTDVMGFMSTAEKERIERGKAQQNEKL